MSIRVIGIAGSLREGSFNKGLLRAAIELVPAGMEITTFNRLGDIPPYNDDLMAKGDPEPVAAFKTAICEADAMLIATPEYNYGVPGVLKNAIDWASRPAGKSSLTRKPTAVMGAAPGAFGSVRAQLSLRQSFLWTDSDVVTKPEVMVFQAAGRFDADAN